MALQRTARDLRKISGGLAASDRPVDHLRFLGGMTVEDVAEALGVSKRTVEREWTMVRAWLRLVLEKGPSA